MSHWRVCVKHAVTLTTPSLDSWWSSTYFQGIYEQKRECKKHTCRFVLKWSVKFNMCWTAFFRSMNNTKQPAEETLDFLMLVLKRKNLLLQAFCYLIITEIQRIGLAIRGGGNFTFVSLRNLWIFTMLIYSMVFLMEK